MINPFEEIDKRLLVIENIINQILVAKQERVEKPSEPEYMNLKQAAKYLDLSTSTMYSYCQKQIIPHFKIRKRLYFSKEQLIEFIKSGARKTNADIAALADSKIFRRNTDE